jgi:hypothetical protein
MKHESTVMVLKLSNRHRTGVPMLVATEETMPCVPEKSKVMYPFFKHEGIVHH